MQLLLHHPHHQSFLLQFLNLRHRALPFCFRPLDPPLLAFLLNHLLRQSALSHRAAAVYPLHLSRYHRALPHLPGAPLVHHSLHHSLRLQPLS